VNKKLANIIPKRTVVSPENVYMNRINRPQTLQSFQNC
jgi:hypothetical protein